MEIAKTRAGTVHGSGVSERPYGNDFTTQSWSR
jgi:hypothetical protein